MLQYLYAAPHFLPVMWQWSLTAPMTSSMTYCRNKSDFFRCILFNRLLFGSLAFVITPSYFIFAIGPFHNFYTPLPAFHLCSAQPNPYTLLKCVFRTHLCSYVCQAHIRTKMLVLLQVLIANQYSLILQVD